MYIQNESCTGVEQLDVICIAFVLNSGLHIY